MTYIVQVNKPFEVKVFSGKIYVETFKLDKGVNLNVPAHIIDHAYFRAHKKDGNAIIMNDTKDSTLQDKKDEMDKAAIERQIEIINKGSEPIVPDKSPYESGMTEEEFEINVLRDTAKSLDIKNYNKMKVDTLKKKIAERNEELKNQHN